MNKSSGIASSASKAKPTSVTPANERVFKQFMEEQGDKPFRRQDIAEAVYKTMKPRVMANALRIADIFLNRLKASGALVKAGHIHWRVSVLTERTLKSGRTVPSATEGTTDLKVTTLCPKKWVSLDLETGDVWEGSSKGWTRASPVVRNEAKSILNSD